MFAKALGADEVVAISHSADKKDDALKLGADKFVATKETVCYYSLLSVVRQQLRLCVAASFRGRR